MEDTKLVAAHMELCRNCLELRGPCFDTFRRCDRDRTQRCGCEPEDPRWKGFDYNTAAELCHGCALEVIPSGSKWSLFFCHPCKDRVMARNRAMGGVAIPLGRHSIMNGVSMGAVTNMSDRIHRLWTFHHAHVRGVVRAIPGVERAVPIDTYLEHARVLLASPEAAFDALVRAMEAPEERNP